MLVEPEAKSMQQDTTQQPVAQVLQIACPYPLDLTARGQLPKHGVDEIANPSQNAAVIGSCLRRMSLAKRSLQENALASQERWTVCIPQQYSPSVPRAGQKTVEKGKDLAWPLDCHCDQAYAQEMSSGNYPAKDARRTRCRQGATCAITGRNDAQYCLQHEHEEE